MVRPPTQALYISKAYDVLYELARARGGVRPHRGITVIPTCGAVPAPVMPQVGAHLGPRREP